MNRENHINVHSRTLHFRQVLWLRVAAVVLLIGVAGLSTLAKNGQYYPGAQPVKYVSLSTKMDVTPAPTALEPVRQQPATKLVPPHPVSLASLREDLAAPPIERVGVTVSMQHRSPPAFLA